MVLLRRATHDDPLWGVVLAEVSHGFRAIVPEYAPTGDEFASWFRSFLDGLGLGAVFVVSDAHFGMCCIDAGLLDPDWLSALVVLTDRAEGGNVSHALADRTETAVSADLIHTDGVDHALDPHEVALRAVQRLRERSGAVG